MRRVDVGETETSLLVWLVGDDKEVAMRFDITSGSSVSGVERRCSLLTQKIGGVKPNAQFSVSSPEPWI